MAECNACYKPSEAVLVCWGANEEMNEPSNTSAQRLLPSNWNPMVEHSKGFWRMDVSVKT